MPGGARDTEYLRLAVQDHHERAWSGTDSETESSRPYGERYPQRMRTGSRIVRIRSRPGNDRTPQRMEAFTIRYGDCLGFVHKVTSNFLRCNPQSWIRLARVPRVVAILSSHAETPPRRQTSNHAPYLLRRWRLIGTGRRLENRGVDRRGDPRSQLRAREPREQESFLT